MKEHKIINESKTHIKAKYEIVNGIKAWKSGRAKAPRIQRECRCGYITYQSLSDRIKFAILEYEVLGGRYCVDVALMDRNKKPVVAIEVLKSHPIPDDKAENLPLLWIEVEAKNIIKNPYKLQPVRARLWPFTCAKCGKRHKTQSTVQNYKRFFERQKNENKFRKPQRKYFKSTGRWIQRS